MQDPERLLSATSDADELERDVLTRLRQAKAPAHARTAAWQGVAAGIAAAGLSASAAGSATATASVAPGAAAKTAIGIGAGTKVALGTATKVVLTAALGAAALGGAYVFQRQGATATHGERARPAQTSRAPSTRSPSTPPSTPPISAPIAAPIPDALPRAAPAQASATRPASKAEPIEPLAEESALLGSARARLRGGDAAAADATLKQLKRRFPTGALLQEREVLRIEVLEARGEHAAARHSARAFVRRYPDSPHSTKLRLLIAP